MENENKRQNSKITRREILGLGVAAGVGVGASLASARSKEKQPSPKNKKSVAGLRAEPIELVRIGMIGVGARGSGHLRHCIQLQGAEVRAVCDIYEPAAQTALAKCAEAGQPEPELYTKGDHDYRRMLERDDLDIVIISTPWRWHTVQAVDAMNAGKHAFTEVPAAVTLDECWQLVDTAEKTGMHCMMMENCCYGQEELMALNMCRQGILGELLHGECGYIHSLRHQMKSVERGTGSWRTGHHVNRNGNLYPTHGLGPIAQYMSINRGDRFDYLTSMSSPALGRAIFAKETFPPDHPRNQVEYICGDMNTSLIKTAKGRTVMVQHDTTTPRPYSRINLIQGVEGIIRGYPGRVCVDAPGKRHEWDDWEEFQEKFDHPLWKKMGALAAESGGHGGMDFLMLWRIIYCLRNGEPLDQDVYDAASWSAVGPLSEASVAKRSASVDFPDFTRGQWEKTQPLGIIS